MATPYRDTRSNADPWGAHGETTAPIHRRRSYVFAGVLASVLLASGPQPALGVGRGNQGQERAALRSTGSPSRAERRHAGPDRTERRHVERVDHGRADRTNGRREDRIGHAFPSNRDDRGTRTRVSGGHGGERRHGSDRSRGHGRGHGHGHDQGGHRHSSHCGHGFWPTWHHGHYWHHTHYRSVFIVPAPIFITTPFFCDPCGIGFAGHLLFHHHVHHVHGIPFDYIDAALVDLDGRLVFIED